MSSTKAFTSTSAKATSEESKSFLASPVACLADTNSGGSVSISSTAVFI